MRLLIDLRTGEPALGLEGEMQEINIERSFNQYMDCLLHTQIFEEQLEPLWGLDIRSMFQVSSSPIWDSLIKYIIAECLNPKREPLISSIETIKLEREDNELKMSIHVKSKYGTVSRNTVGLNE